MFKLIKINFVAVCASLFISSISNANADDIDIYIGAGVGTSSLDLKLENKSYSSEFWSSSITHKDIDDSLVTKRLTVGFQFHKYYGIEVAFTDFGEFSYIRESTSQNNYSNGSDSSIQRYSKREKNRGLSLSHALFFPVANWLAFNVNAGALLMQRNTDESNYSRLEFTSDVGSPTITESEWQKSGKAADLTATVGLGAVFSAGKHFGAKLGWERSFQTTSENLDVDVLSLELRYRF